MKMLDLLKGNGVAIESDHGNLISYAELRARVNERVKRWLVVYSVEKVDREAVVVHEVSTLEQIVSIFAGFELGMIVNVKGDPAVIHPRWVCSNGELHSNSASPRNYGDTVDAIFLTSGTTESSRVVGHRQESLLTCATEMANVLSFDSTSRVALTLDVSFHYGFSVMTSTFYANGTLLLSALPLSDPRFVFHLNGWFEKVRPTVLATVPQGWAVFSRTLGETVWEEVVTIVSAGDIMPTELLHRISAQNPSAKIHILYGSTEVLRSCHRSWIPSDEEGCIGSPLPSAQLSIEEDIVFQRGSTLFEEMWEGERCIHRQDRCRLPDVLRVDEVGTWYFIQRSTDLLKVSGKRVSPLLIERCLIDTEGIDDAIVVEYNDSLLGILCVPGNQKFTTIEVAIPKVYQPKHWIVLRQPFPLTPRNKRSRQWIKNYALRHFDPASSPPFRLVVR